MGSIERRNAVKIGIIERVADRVAAEHKKLSNYQSPDTIRASLLLDIAVTETLKRLELEEELAKLRAKEL